MIQPLEQQCILLFNRCTKDIESLFSLWRQSIRIVPNGNGTSKQDYIKILSKDGDKWKSICDVYPSTSKIKFEKDNSKLRSFDLVKKQLKHYSYMDIEESEWYQP